MRSGNDNIIAATALVTVITIMIDLTKTRNNAFIKNSIRGNINNNTWIIIVTGIRTMPIITV